MASRKPPAKGVRAVVELGLTRIVLPLSDAQQLLELASGGMFVRPNYPGYQKEKPHSLGLTVLSGHEPINENEDDHEY